MEQLQVIYEEGFLVYEEMRKCLTIYEEAISHIWQCICSILNFLIYEENLIFFFMSVPKSKLLLNYVTMIHSKMSCKE